MNKELTYWLTLAHVPKIQTKKKNEIIVRLFEKSKSIIDFFEFEQAVWGNDYELSQSEIVLFEEARNELSTYAFMVEDLLEQGYSIIPITSQDYSPTLKKNLGRTYAPPVIYTKGNLQIMKEKSIAIVGSRKANDISLEFTDNVAKNASKDYKVVVSGFAKGVDKQALDSAIKYKGQSIIVLPQGIATFQSGFKKYYKQIIDGDVLVLSTFYPKAPWSVQLAMARNPIIYGLTSEIYVAESSEKGGTWSGVMDGLRKGRTIYVRKPNSREKNANNILISKGGIAVDIEGNLINYEITEKNKSIVSEPDSNNIEEKIIDFLKAGVFPAKKIVDTLKIDWSSKKVSDFLKNRKDILTVKGKPLKFTHKDRSIQIQKSLFD
ncbi:MAG: DNA-processing protein DprA [Bacteroidales bacterium]|jgi:predicted Rossmann fold nucleotide-binding protein DprA/Smf involved in DNA uptake|nr:DNA-processing protein DprA [Bacteroidales bacterium]MDD4235544.1 DNA-processing protein DprA [Bacteroidales bacterium]MDY0161379.1 DNA-processing protein DprA [Bacteroidales bacterium]